MTSTGPRADAYAAVLSGSCARPDDTALAALCEETRGTWPFDPQALWEGAVLAGVTARQLDAALRGDRREMIAALADLAGEMPGSAAVRYNQAAWAAWQP